MKNPKKGGFKFLFLFFLFLALIAYGCADDGGGSGLTGIDAEASGFASTGGITLPASIENADTIPADDIDMKSSTGDTTTNEEWLTDQDAIDTSITLPASVAKSMAKYDITDIFNYTVEAFLMNQNGATNIEFSWVSNTYNPPTFSTNLPVDGDTSYFCFVLRKSGVVTYRSHFRKITKVYGVTGLYAYASTGLPVELSWSNPTNDYFASCQVWYGSNGVASVMYTNNFIGTTVFIGDPSLSEGNSIFRVVTVDTNGNVYAASSTIW